MKSELRTKHSAHGGDGRTGLPRMSTGIPHLDVILGGGLPIGSVSVVAGAPGSGKTIFAQQICFHNATPQRKVLLFSTLSEPTAKSIKYLSQFSFFDRKKLGRSIFPVDLGVMAQEKGLSAVTPLIMDHIRRVKPAIVVIDSFKVFDDLTESREERRKFGFEMAVNLMAWEVTALLLGEYGPADYQTNAFFSIVDGVIAMSQREAFGEAQRFLNVVKMRGTSHSRDDVPFLITDQGLDVFAPRLGIDRNDAKHAASGRCQTHIGKLDELIGPGIPWGSSLLISGVAGTGKTVLSLEFIYRGALAGEKGIIFSFEETEERLRAAARGLGCDIDREIARGMIEIVFIPQPDIMVDTHMAMIQRRVTAMKAKRVVIDSVSVFLHKVSDAEIFREKVYDLCSIVQSASAVGFFATDIPYGAKQVSRFGVEETVVDGVIILSATEEGLDRERYIEVYKIRNTAHLKGRHNMVIDRGGVAVFPRYSDAGKELARAAPLDGHKRLASGVPGLDPLLGGGLMKRSVTLISGSAGIGKTLMGIQFALEGIKKGERALYVALEEGPEQLEASAGALGLPLARAIKRKEVQLLYISRENVRAGQFLSVLADRLIEMKAKRVVLDATTQMLTEYMPLGELRHVLYKLVNRFKALDITSVLTMEAPTLSSSERVTELGLSPIADNLLMLRYASNEHGLSPTLMVVKTRGADHDRRAHPIEIKRGGVHVLPVLATKPR